jgi:hypothetical protein
LFGDKLLYVTNDSILTTIDSIVGNTTYTTEHKSAVIRVLDKDLNVVTQDTLAEYTISQFDLSAIDSTSFTFSAWSSDQSLLSSWSLIGHEMTEINEQKKPNEFDFTIYPNPTSDYINIIGVEEGSLIKIIDSSGRIVFDEFYHGTIDIHGFARGIYCIIIKDRVKKIIIQ